MPDISAAEVAKLEAEKSAGAYELQPEHGPANAMPPVNGYAAGDAPAPASEAPSATEPDMSAYARMPIRMVHPDPGCTADGFHKDETGAIMVPYDQVEAMKNHGFVIEYLPEE